MQEHLTSVSHFLCFFVLLLSYSPLVDVQDQVESVAVPPSGSSLCAGQAQFHPPRFRKTGNGKCKRNEFVDGRKRVRKKAECEIQPQGDRVVLKGRKKMWVPRLQLGTLVSLRRIAIINIVYSTHEFTYCHG